MEIGVREMARVWPGTERPVEVDENGGGVARELNKMQNDKCLMEN